MTDMAMFPLGTVLLPGMPLSLQLFEPRYLTMLRDVEAGDGRFGVVLIERGFEVGGGDQRFGIGTTATIEVSRKGAGGRVQLVARGRERFEVVSWLPDDPYPRAEVNLLPEFSWGDDLVALLAATENTVRDALRQVNAAWSAGIELSPDPVTRSWQLAGITPVGDLDRLRLLQSESTEELLERTARMTDDAVELIALQRPDN